MEDRTLESIKLVEAGLIKESDSRNAITVAEDIEQSEESTAQSSIAGQQET